MSFVDSLGTKRSVKEPLGIADEVILPTKSSQGSDTNILFSVLEQDFERAEKMGDLRSKRFD